MKEIFKYHLYVDEIYREDKWMPILDMKTHTIVLEIQGKKPFVEQTTQYINKSKRTIVRYIGANKIINNYQFRRISNTSITGGGLSR